MLVLLQALLLGLVAMPGLVEPVAAATAPTKEYQIKAVFLFNFAQFVEWPPDAFATPGDPIVIGVLGADPFGSFLDETVEGESVGGRPLAVQRYARPEDIGTCHVLYISSSEHGRLPAILDALDNRSILTVTDAGGAESTGVMIQFVLAQNKVRLRINVDAARLAALTISSKLLRPAEIVTASRGD